MKLEHRDNCILVKYIPDRGEASGYFEEETGKIYVSVYRSLLERECVYFHELTHKECFDKKCKCWSKKTDYLSEYHAMRGELRKVIACKSIRMKRAYMKNLKRCLKKYRGDPKLWRSHLSAVEMMMRTGEFKEFARG